jgi:putative transposase
MREEDKGNEGVIYHAYARGNNKLKIFHIGHDYAKYKRNILKYKQKYNFKLYAYTLMPNHVHLLLEPELQQNVREIMKSLNLSYSLWHNRRYGCVGHVWQGRYRRRFIKDDNDFLVCMAYIEMNPVKAGLVENPQSYKWSSYHERSMKSQDRLIEFHPIFLELSSNEDQRMKAYHAIMFNNVP